MTSAEVKAKTRELLITRIATRILDANTTAAAEALAREVVAALEQVETGAAALATAQARVRPKDTRAI